jgi:hypothetical protein
MTIKTDDIKRLYRTYLEEKRPASREECPSIKDLANLPTKIRKGRKKIIRHLLSCVSCSEELESILIILRSQQDLMDDLKPLVEENQAKHDKAKRRFPRLILKGFVPYAIAVAVLFIVAFIVYRPDLAKNTENRGKTTQIIQTLSPADQKISRSSLKIEWKGIEKFSYCYFELFDESLKPLWKSPKANDKKMIIPPNIGQILHKNRTYFWMVTVFLEDGRSFESSLAKFVLTN